MNNTPARIPYWYEPKKDLVKEAFKVARCGEPFGNDSPQEEARRMDALVYLARVLFPDAVRH
jgi:hypothetical protein